jgi:LuxR family maltose regulon positive regulatory protein
LFAALLERWERRLVLVVGGAGLGKTTLLAQVLGENRLAPRGVDVWLGCEPADRASRHLGTGLCDALGVHGPDEDDRSTIAGVIAEAIWQRAPEAVCLVLDDVHEVEAGSQGMSILAELLATLPANGHMVVASRSKPALPTARLAAHGDLIVIEEDEMLLTDAELREVAERRGVAAEQLGATAGWPALAALAASAPQQLRDDFLWEEVLNGMTDEQRRLLAVVSDLGGADDDLIAAATGTERNVAEVLARVPLVAIDAMGWCSAHSLWQSVLSPLLTTAERADVRRRAAQELVRRGDAEQAFLLLAEIDAWEDVAELLVRACGSEYGRLPASTLQGWRSAVPAAMREHATGLLLEGALCKSTDPAEPRTLEVLERAAHSFRAEDNTAGEAAALSHLAHLAWWRQDASALSALGPRIAELEGVGEPLARTLASLGRAIAADIRGDAAKALARLDAIDAEHLTSEWAAIVAFHRAGQLLTLGRIAEAVAVAEEARAIASPVFRLTLEAIRQTRWHLGEIDAVLNDYPDLVARTEASGVAQNIVGVAADAARTAAYVGDVDVAERYVARAYAANTGVTGGPIVRLALAEAAIAIAGGDEPRAENVLIDVLARHPIAGGAPRRAYLDALPLTYVLVPTARACWDAEDLAACFTRNRELASAIVAQRQGDGAETDWPSLDEIRAALPLPWAVEFAVGGAAHGRAEGRALVERLGARARPGLRALADRGSAALATTARRLLTEIPAPPDAAVEIAVLGPLELRRGGGIVDEPAWRRERVRRLLMFLVAHPTTTRDAVSTALWEDFDDRSATNNFRVTLSHLLDVLQPARGQREPSYFVRQHGRHLALVRSEWLMVDAWEFERALDAAAAAEDAGSPSLALAKYREALHEYRGDFLADLLYEDWAIPERERLRARFSIAAVRAGELVLAAGDREGEESSLLAERVLAVDPWSEPAYRLLAASHVARGNRSAARRALERCREALAELGAEPEPATLALERRPKTSDSPHRAASP